MKEQSLIIFKPDCMEKQLFATVWDIFRKSGLEPVACKMTMLTEEILRLHYAHIYGKPYYRPLIDFMTSRPVIVSVWEGEEAVLRIRRLAGPTNSLEAPAGTIRGNYGDSVRRNIIHSSDSAENAKTEIARFFTKEEIFNK